jgi:hypothetical protein
MPFGQKNIEVFSSEDKKKERPFFKGLVTEYQGKTKISLWATDEFKAYMEKLAKG